MSPYTNLPDEAFWRLAVTDRDLFDIDRLWNPKFLIQQNAPVATYGSCFAQNIGRFLRARDFNWLRTEQAPIGLSPENAELYSYNLFSTRTGNIYTTSLLHQWVSWAARETPLPTEVWEEDGRFYDPFRPVVEPNGFATREEVVASRAFTLQAFRRSLAEAKFLIFTMGLTEHWYDNQEGYEYPLCPGTAVGRFVPDRHEFRNHGYDAVKSHLKAAIELMRGFNPALHILLTVSPVPLTATRSGLHVVVATMQSKSILRAVAADLTEEHEFIDYFPSYEIFNSPAFRGVFFGPNQRNISRQGLAFVMDHFVAGLDPEEPSVIGHCKDATSRREGHMLATRDRCEEELLDAFRAHR